MARFTVRVWLPDKPGALGRVASAIGSVGASLIGIDILEHGGGWAIDELIVDAVDSENAIEKISVALTFIEGVSVEDIRPSDGEAIDARLDALEMASELVEQTKSDALREVLVRRARRAMSADWAALISLVPDDTLFVSEGDAPSSVWLRAFVEGSRSSEAVASGTSGPDDTAWAELPDAKSALVLGRDGRPFRSRERVQLFELVRIADRVLTTLPE